MKICFICKLSKPFTDYYVNKSCKDGFFKTCKPCLAVARKLKYASDPAIREQRQKNYTAMRRRNRLIVWDYLLEHPCIDCGQADPMVLEFDHVDRSTKSYEISEASRGKSVKNLLAEMAKCVVRCANCHRKKTYKDLGWETPYTDYDWNSLK